jgi:hypothetical protein
MIAVKGGKFFGGEWGRFISVPRPAAAKGSLEKELSAARLTEDGLPQFPICETFHQTEIC